MSHAAAKLSPDATEYLTFDPTRPTVPVNFFEDISYGGRALAELRDQHHIDDPQMQTALQVASRIYEQIVRAIQEASFIPRINMANWAYARAKDYLAMAAFAANLAEMPGFDDQLRGQARGNFEQLRDEERQLAAIAIGMEQGKTSSRCEGSPKAHDLSTLTPTIVARAIRYGLEKALMDAGLKLKQTEPPVAPHDTLVDPRNLDAYAARISELKLMTSGTKEALDDLLTPAGSACVEDDLRNLGENTFGRGSRLSASSLSRDALDLFRRYPYDTANPSADQIMMSTLNPLDLKETVTGSMTFNGGSLGFEMMTNASLRNHVLARMREV